MKPQMLLILSLIFSLAASDAAWARTKKKTDITPPGNTPGDVTDDSSDNKDEKPKTRKPRKPTEKPVDKVKPDTKEDDVDVPAKPKKPKTTPKEKPETKKDDEKSSRVPSRLPSQGIYDNASDLPTYDMIKGAKKSIDIEIYQMGDPEFRRLLREALNAGIKMRIIKDGTSLGEKCRVFNPAAASDDEDCKDQKAFLKEVKSAGGEYVPFNKKELCGNGKSNCYEHGKMIIVDEKAVLLSTGNFNSSSFCNKEANPDHCNRDFSYVSSDATVVRALSAVFENDLKGERYDVMGVMSSAAQAKVTVSPHSLDPLVEFIRSSRETLVIENQYLNDPTMNAEIIAAAKRGVKVKLVLASLCSFGMPDEGAIDRIDDNFIAFESAGVEVRMFSKSVTISGKPGYMHAKAIIVDGERAWMGSVNGSSMSLSSNREFGVFFNTPAQVNKFERVVMGDFNHPNTQTWEESARCEKDRSKR